MRRATTRGIKRLWITGLLATLLGVNATAASINVSEPWVRATVAPQTSTGAFMTIVSKAPATLIAASSPVAQNIQFHAMSMNEGVMRMRALKAVPLRANVPVNFAPSGLHMMLTGLKQPIRSDARVPLTLTFIVNGKEQTVSVEARAAMGAPHSHH